MSKEDFGSTVNATLRAARGHTTNPDVIPETNKAMNAWLREAAAEPSNTAARARQARERGGHKSGE